MTVRDLIDSPIGTLEATWTEAGICSLSMQQTSDAPLREHNELRTQLAQYFACQRRSFDLALAPADRAPFTTAVHSALETIDYGETISYMELAARAGSPQAVRAAGSACRANPLLILIPCHRVLRADGSLGGYAGGLQAKRFLLDLEQGQKS